MKTVLYQIDKKGKIRETTVELIKNEHNYVIKSTSGLIDGKKTNAPEDVITQGKAKRSIEEQAALQYNSKVKKYKDKGMKSLDDLPENINNLKLEDFLMIHLSKTDQNGAKKCMRATDYQEIKGLSDLFKTEKFLCSRKHDGVRCQIFKKDGVITSASRGGGDYNPAIQHILTHTEIIKFFNTHQDVILDGELYIHGKNLQELSGIARLKDDKKIKERDKLNFHVYELMNDKPANKRYELIKEYTEELKGCEYIHCVEQETIESLEKALELHDKYVSEGYEGAVIKTFSNLYESGKSSTMLKIKKMQDAEFEIVGIVEKKRPEDFVFVIKTGELTTEAKPTGTIEERLALKAKVSELIGKFATVQFFGKTPDGRLNLPVFKCVRDYE